jgi:Protein of unknown function (DUF3606)
MSTKTRPRLDGPRIALDSREQISYWATALGVSELQLAAAIHEVGDLVAMVVDYLQQQDRR